MKLFFTFLILAITIVPSYAQNLENIQSPKYITQSKKVVDLNLILPSDWKIESRTDNQQLLIKKDPTNYITLNISDYVDVPKNTICYNKADYKLIDSKFLRKNSSNVIDTNLQEYIFRKQDSLTFGPILLNYTTTQEDLNNLEVEGSKAFYIRDKNEYSIKLPTLGEVYELCDIINNLGPVNINDNLQYIIKSRSSDTTNQAIIDNIIMQSNWGNSLSPDAVNQQAPISAIAKTVNSSDKSNVNIFFLFFGLLVAFSFVLLFMTRQRNIEK